MTTNAKGLPELDSNRIIHFRNRTQYLQAKKPFTASTTSSGDISSIQKYPSLRRQLCERQGEQSGFLVNTFTLSPQGRQTSGSLAAENKLTTGTPQAAARCPGPESEPTNT
jgi:hypothetical protein